MAREGERQARGGAARTRAMRLARRLPALFGLQPLVDQVALAARAVERDGDGARDEAAQRTIGRRPCRSNLGEPEYLAIREGARGRGRMFIAQRKLLCGEFEHPKLFWRLRELVWEEHKNVTHFKHKI